MTESLPKSLPKRGAGRPRQVTDDEIFNALAIAISEHGPIGFSINKVAERLHMTGPALGHRFGNKQGLLLAFAARHPSATDEYLTSLNARYTDPRQAIVEGLVGLLSGQTTRAEVGNNLAFLHLDLTNEELRQHAVAGATVIRRHLQGLLGKAGARSAEQETFAHELWVLWNGAIIGWAIDGTGTLESALRRQLNNALTRELGDPPTAPGQ